MEINNCDMKNQKEINMAPEREVKTAQEARENIEELIKIRNQIDFTTDEGQGLIQKMNSKIDQNDQFIKANVNQLGKSGSILLKILILPIIIPVAFVVLGIVGTYAFVMLLFNEKKRLSLFKQPI